MMLKWCIWPRICNIGNMSAPFSLLIFMLKTKRLKNLSTINHLIFTIKHWHEKCVPCTMHTLFIEVYYIKIFDTFKHYPTSSYDKRKKHILEIYSRDDHVLKEALCVESSKISSRINHTRATSNVIVYFNKEYICRMRRGRHMNW